MRQAMMFSKRGTSSAEVTAAIAAAVPDVQPDWIVGNWYDMRSSYGGTPQATAMTASVIYCSPLIVPKATPIDAIGVAVTVAAAAGKVLRFGIYSATASGFPGTLLLDAGTIAADTIGDKTITIAQTLPAGLVYPAVVSDGTPTIQSLGVSVVMLYGVTTVAGTNFRGGPNLGTTGTTLTTPYNGTNHTTNNFFRIGVRAA